MQASKCHVSAAAERAASKRRPQHNRIVAAGQARRVNRNLSERPRWWGSDGGSTLIFVMRRLAALISQHRRRVARVLFGLGLFAVAYQLLPNVPRQTELEFALGEGHARVVELRVAFEQEGEEMHGVRFGFPEGAPRTVRHSLRLPSGEYVVRCELRERGGDSLELTRRLITPADGVVRIALGDQYAALGSALR